MIYLDQKNTVQICCTQRCLAVLQITGVHQTDYRHRGGKHVYIYANHMYIHMCHLFLDPAEKSDHFKVC